MSREERVAALGPRRRKGIQGPPARARFGVTYRGEISLVTVRATAARYHENDVPRKKRRAFTKNSKYGAYMLHRVRVGIPRR